MSISSALSNALSGLAGSSRSAQTISSNIANAMTKGYAPRDVILSARDQGMHGGVSVLGISRQIDPAIRSDRRAADAAMAGSEGRLSGLTKVSTLMGIPGDEGTLTDLLSKFDAALLSAASMPHSTTRLDVAISRANEVANKLNDLSADIQSLRETADHSILNDVSRLNSLLSDLEKLSTRVPKATGHEKAALLDQRDLMIDDINKIVPVRIFQRDQGAIALYSSQGMALFDGHAQTIEFSRTATITPHLTIESGLLSGLSIDGEAVAMNAIQGGSLSAHFQVRDQVAVDANVNLDAVARDLAERFQANTIDPTLAANDPGLFTDLGQRSDPTNETGLAGRLRLNRAVDPDAGGDSWKLRDGLSSTTQGATGDGRILNAMHDALNARQLPVSTAFPENHRSIILRAADIQSASGSTLHEAERHHGFARSQREALITAELAGGVDTDAELQKLLLVEQSYSANARVIETIGQLIDRLTRI